MQKHKGTRGISRKLIETTYCAERNGSGNSECINVTLGGFLALSLGCPSHVTSCRQSHPHGAQRLDGQAAGHHTSSVKVNLCANVGKKYSVKQREELRMSSNVNDYSLLVGHFVAGQGSTSPKAR